MEKLKTDAISKILQKNFYKTCLVESKVLAQKILFYNPESPDFMWRPKFGLCGVTMGV